MRAWVLHDIGDIRLSEMAMPEPGQGEVLVRVHAVGICGSDIPRIYQTGAHQMPLIPGHEFAGEVVAVHDDDRTDWLGKRVGIFPLIPCMECEQCKRHHYEMCSHYNYLGSRCDGGFAEYVTVPEWNLIELPDSVSYEEAAMLEPTAVAVHAMRRVKIEPGEKLAICGMGTIGMLLLNVLMRAESDRDPDMIRNAQIEDARMNDKGLPAGIDKNDIYVIGNKDFQRGKALALGLPEEHFCDSRREDPAGYLRKLGGVDVYYECVGKQETVMLGMDSLKPLGRLCVVGNPYSDMVFEKNVYWRILRSQLTITGSWNSSYDHVSSDDWHYVLRQLEAGRLSLKELITHSLEFEELETGLRIMRDKTEDYLKVMIRMEGKSGTE